MLVQQKGSRKLLAHHFVGQSFEEALKLLTKFLRTSCEGVSVNIVAKSRGEVVLTDLYNQSLRIYMGEYLVMGFDMCVFSPENYWAEYEIA